MTDVVITSVLNSAIEFLTSAIREKFVPETTNKDGVNSSDRRLPSQLPVEETELAKYSRWRAIKNYRYSGDLRWEGSERRKNSAPWLFVNQNIDSVMSAMQSAHDFEVKRRDERLRQARLSFNAALILLIVGTLVVLIGVILLFRNQNITAGIVTSGAGVISNFFSAILFKFSRDANDRLDKIKTNLAKIETYQQTLAAISDTQNAAKQEQP